MTASSSGYQRNEHSGSSPPRRRRASPAAFQDRAVPKTASFMELLVVEKPLPSPNRKAWRKLMSNVRNGEECDCQSHSCQVPPWQFRATGPNEFLACLLSLVIMIVAGQGGHLHQRKEEKELKRKEEERKRKEEEVLLERKAQGT